MEKWVKKTRLSELFSISTTTISRLVNNETFKEGIHYKVFPFGVRFNLETIEKNDTSNKDVENILDKML